MSRLVAMRCRASGEAVCGHNKAPPEGEAVSC